MIYFVDDDPKSGELFARFARSERLEVQHFNQPGEALERHREQPAELIISDHKMPQMTGVELLRAIRENDKDVPFIMITGYADVDMAIQALRLGADDFIKKPYDPDELLAAVQRALAARELKRENRRLRRQIESLSDKPTRRPMIGRSAAMARVQRLIDKLAMIRCNVIINGESGTGKELVARALHERSAFSSKPFMVIDCGALSETLLESELFGHEQGAFTGAQTQKKGLLEAAQGGTVFLDEIGNISDAMQTKLLRVVQEQQIHRVGGVTPINIDVRFVVATNRDLEQMVAAGEFRHDLYHRLNVVTIALPPLRERRDDIPELLDHYLRHFAAQYQRGAVHFSPASTEALINHDWPGNVRELSNVVERLVALSDGKQLEWQADPQTTHRRADLAADQPTLEELEKRYILQTLEDCGGNKQQTADRLGINKTTLWRKLARYD